MTAESRLIVASTETNGRRDPLGIPTDPPVFGWTLALRETDAGAETTAQTAYEIEVGTAPGAADVWSSGRVDSSAQVDVAYAGPAPASGTRYHWSVRVWDEAGHVSPFSDDAWFETGLQHAADWGDAAWIGGETGPDIPAPLLRTTFTLALGETVVRARAYASAHGVYDLVLNGARVGDDVLAPGYTDYDVRILSQTYDVTGLIRTGENVIGARVGDGWWAGKVGMLEKGTYGTDLAVIVRLRLDLADGSTRWIDSDASWRQIPGPFTATDLQLGESYDARRARDGWSEPGYDDGEWMPVVQRPSDTARLSPQPDEPVVQTEEVPAVSVSEPAPGVWVYDLGQNLVGVARVRLTGRAGDTATLRHAEVLNPDGTLYTDNLRGADATDRYTFAADGAAVYQPAFTQHGFRYVEVTGVATPPTLSEVTGVVLGSRLERTGILRTSDDLLNRLLSNVVWGARGNFLSIPTDTPARDERLGWTGDIAIFAPTAAALFDMRGFLAKWMQDVRDAQFDDGQIPAVVPSTRGFFAESGPGWEEAIIAVPYALYRAYGDLAIVRANWPAMLRFYDFVAAGVGDDDLGVYAETFFTSTDWLSLEPTDGIANRAKSTAIWADTARMVAELAAALGDPRADEITARAVRARRAFVEAWVADDGTVAGDTQTGYALALGMGLIEDEALRERVGERFVAALARADHHLATGFIGTPFLLPALSAIGRDDLAYRLLLNETYPSWGYEIRRGATTVWERWNSIEADGSFGPVEMNSFNHYAYGAVVDWVFQTVGGVRAVEPGYRRSLIAARPGGGLTSSEVSLRTVYGAVSVAWRLVDGRFELDVTVPVGTTADVRMPAGFALPDGVRAVEVGAGTHAFVAVAE